MSFLYAFTDKWENHAYVHKDAVQCAGVIMTDTQRVRLSIVVVCYDMAREVKRTLFALSDKYQIGVTSDQYEIIVIENGKQVLDPEWVEAQGDNVRYHFHETQSASPSAAVNVGGEIAKGEYIALIVDGARIPTPGMVRYTLDAMNTFHPCLVGTLAWHLGPAVQRVSRLSGYCQAVEDDMLESIKWDQDGYRLFEVATIAPSSKFGFMNGIPAECSWLALPHADFKRLGGYDEGFQSPGGGLVNHDFMKRAGEISTLNPVLLLGEGTFHQIHQGAATSAPDIKPVMSEFKEEYRKLRGNDFIPSRIQNARYIGAMPDAAKQFIDLE